MELELTATLLDERKKGCPECFGGLHFACYPLVYPTLYYNIFRPCSAAAIDGKLRAVAAITTTLENGIFDQEPRRNASSLLGMRSRRNFMNNASSIGSIQSTSKDWKSIYANLIFDANTTDDLDKKLKFLILMNEDGRRVEPELKDVDLNDPFIYDRPYFTLEQLKHAV